MSACSRPLRFLWLPFGSSPQLFGQRNLLPLQNRTRKVCADAAVRAVRPHAHPPNTRAASGRSDSAPSAAAEVAEGSAAGVAMTAGGRGDGGGPRL